MINPELIKQAAGGIFANRREELEPEEEQDIRRGERQWFPKVFQEPADPLTEDLASPGKAGLLSAIPWALGGGLAGYVGGNVLAGDNPAKGEQYGRLGAALLGGGLGLGAGIRGIMKRRDKNELVREYIRSLPPHATRRMLELDPLYQMEEMRDMDKSELGRAMMARKAMVRFR